MADLLYGGVVQIAALGRPFQNGMMYDCRTNTLIPWITLWDPDVLRQNTDTRLQESSDFHVITEDTLSKKGDAMDMKAELKLSFLSGLVPVSGSAKYLSNHKTSMRQERVTLMYRYTTRFEELTMRHLQRENMKYSAIYEHRTATHVVVGIVYGGQAFFMFDQFTSGDENRREIRGELKALADKIAGHGSSVSGETERTKRVRCQFYGDMLLPKNPTTYREAVQLCKDLPKLVKENENKAVPVMVWLYPLYHLDPSAAQVEQSISPSTVEEVESCLQELQEIDLRCTDLLETDVCENFTGIRDDVRNFRKRVKQFVLKFKQNIIEIIRSSDNREESERGPVVSAEEKLYGLLAARDLSPFKCQRLNDWVREREAQVQVLGNFMREMGAMRYITKDELHIEFLKPSNKVVACFEINLSGNDNQTKNMDDYLAGRAVGLLARTTSVVAGISQSMAQNAHCFRNFALANVNTPAMSLVIAEDRDPGNDQGGFIRIYKTGTRVQQDCTLLLPRDAPQAERKCHDTIAVSWTTANDDPSCTKGYELSYQRLGDDPVVVSVDKKTNNHVLNDLLPASQYLIKVRAVCVDWYCAYSDTLEVSTRFCSPPGTPTTRQVFRNKLSLKWKVPNTVAIDQEVESYSILCRNTSDDMWREIDMVPAVEGETLQREVQVDSGKRCFFKIMAHSGGCASLASGESAPVMTNTVDIDWLRKNGFGACASAGGSAVRSIYRVKLNEVKRVGVDATHSYYFGYPKAGHDVEEKTIVLIGGKEVQKGKLLNGMLNYILGVEYQDEYRFVLREDGVRDLNDDGVPDNHLSVYKIYQHDGFVLPFNLNVVYTPDFGDVLESESVLEMTRQMEGHLSASSAEGGISHIDLICFVRHAAMSQPTPMQICVFNSILALLGSMASNNIATLFTFADECEQVSMGGVCNAGEDIWYMFDTEAILAGCTDGTAADDCVSEMKWATLMKNFKKFFDYLSAINPMDLEQTREFLATRDQFEVRLSQVYDLVHRYHQLQVECKVLQRHKSEVKNNQAIPYSFTECVSVKADFLVGQYTTTSNAVARSQPRGTIACVKDQMTIMRSTAELKRQYEEAEGRVMSVGELIRAVQKQIDALGAVLSDLVNEICRRQSELEGLALVPYPWSAVRYMDVLIETEQADKFQGWEERVVILQTLKEQIRMYFTQAPNGNAWCVIL